MFDRLLIANRGEIACRIIRTCRRLGIHTISVYSAADANALHVREADEAVCIGPAKAAESYLDAAAVVRAARDRRAQAIHPGYGFLSERLELIDACEAAGIVFVGPHRAAIESMGSKIESKRIARKAGVPCVPGYDGDDQSDRQLREQALALGFPLLIKASAGGGGKGMRRVDRADDFPAQLTLARAEARAAFGDDRVLLERCITRPRHVEVQLLGDRHGNLLHLFERECSIQRNFQKLVEETPAHRLNPAVRTRLFEAALSLGREIAYDSAGTVEFVLDADSDDEPYFLEMNTRLQVEHPVTEMTTGIDLVECQLRAAAGEPLELEQAGIEQHGWAIEARVNAEVPEQGFAPSFGPVIDYSAPAGEGIRIDSGVDAASEVVAHYDSLVAKVIGWGATRDIARRRLRHGLASLRIAGIQTTQPLLLDVTGAPEFQQVLTTRFLDALWPQGWQPDDPALQSLARAAAAAAWLRSTLPRVSLPMDSLVGWRLTSTVGGSGRTPVIATDDSGSVDMVVRVGSTTMLCEAGTTTFTLTGRDADSWIDSRSGRAFRCLVRDDEVFVWSDGWSTRVRLGLKVSSKASQDRSADNGDALFADLPGVLSSILVAPGDVVVAGAPLVVLEAMKLFHTMSAPRDGVVKAIPVPVGSTVPKGALLLELEP